MRRAVAALRSQARWWQQQQAMLVENTGTRSMAMAALDDEAFQRRRSSLDAAVATPPASSSAVAPSSSSFVRAMHTSAPASAAAASAAAAATTSPRFFITGARGQIGVELTRMFAKFYGPSTIVASDLPAAVAAGKSLPEGLVEGVRYVACDVTDREGLSRGNWLGERETEGGKVLVFFTWLASEQQQRPS